MLSIALPEQGPLNSKGKHSLALGVFKVTHLGLPLGVAKEVRYLELSQ